MNKDETLKYIGDNWDSWYMKGLCEFIDIPNLSPNFDEEYFTNGQLEKAIEHIDNYINKLEIQGITKHSFKAENGMPLITYVVEGTEGVNQNVLMYGHLDKQPYGEGWDADKPPNKATIVGDHLYGRGGADDGYSPFTCMMSVKACQLQGVKMPRIVLAIEAEEESGSVQLLNLLAQAKDVIKIPDVVLCMDSGAFDYENLWITSSLRGITIVDLKVDCGKAGYHSGETGGIVPETFRIIREMLDKIEQSSDGKVLIPELQAAIPAWKQAEAEHMVKQFGRSLCDKYGIVEGGKYCQDDNLEQQYLDSQWNAFLSVTGADGLPPIQSAGNVVRPTTSIRLSMRLPPAVNHEDATPALEKILQENVPYNAKVTLTRVGAGNGWCKKDYEPWLDESMKVASQHFYEKPAASYGMGGSIPLLSELEKMYPKSQIVALGLIGPGTNAHGPNEMMNIPYAKKLTCTLAHIVGDIGQH
uniref:Uncharacterized protein n=1 Tax=Strombidium inclinatum TaxID=197538 RepID=A0A7S3MZR0_9SPIT|mmetsp:Transcript_41787/g.63820  ORF Transcript_41787/g.63820 Transcript_41787/m.63820 type:complete len:472 (+) Transcript_41787:37-1452(+)|eukprot:CAMPEP_0170493334 /NCGR_PEP_ID=MMETSP0208-20121228/13728_1 /TAXON_ID=197538 /ORGANISM="Strombidium inclinatum, Strain S3" /LENGTH=471 /DNA_ID=CAMNT_0010769251 /DNA_START=19 /DNA_END=1434 /DNA_ORIENTATION=+